MEKKTIVAISIGAILLIAIGFLIYQNHQLDQTKKQLKWCFEEYVGVDKAIIQCIDDKQGTLTECLGAWNHKAYLLAEIGCRQLIFKEAT